MEQADALIRTKLRPPFIRVEIVPRPRLRARIAEGLRGPLTLITAPAGFGKTTLLASHVAGPDMPVGWLSLDRADDQEERFLRYLVAALQGADDRIGSEAAQRLAVARQPIPEAVLTSLVNDLAAAGREMALVLDDYQFIRSRSVHEAVSFLLEHSPKTFHMVIATRSDPPLPLPRLRARGQMVELRAADLRFTQGEAAQFLNDVMGLRLDARSVSLLEARTEGWVAGLQMAALSMRDREDVRGFIEAFSGTNRYIMDYLLEEVLASQPPDVQHFLLHTSILERLTGPLCDAVLAGDQATTGKEDEPSTRSPSSSVGSSGAVLDHLERANLFVVPLDDERTWYRYHHLFADLLRTQLRRSLGAPDVARLHVRAADWHAQHGSILAAIQHASLASDGERVERLIKQNYVEMASRGEMTEMRTWIRHLSDDLVHRRPWLCIYAAYSHAWFGELDEADRLLEKAEQRVQAGIGELDDPSMLAHLAYTRSRVTAMRGDIDGAIQLCRAARDHAPVSNLVLRLDIAITLGYEHFLKGDFASASEILNQVIRSRMATDASVNAVAASCVMARLYTIQGRLNRACDTYRRAAQSMPDASGQHLGARALVDIGMAELLCEWNDLDSALERVRQGLDLLPLWDKADDLALACVTLARIHLAQGNRGDAEEVLARASHLIQTRGVFSEARQAVEVAQVKLWLAQGDLRAASGWAASQEEQSGSDGRFRYENELTQLMLARIWIALSRPCEAVDLLSKLKEAARSAGRMGRVIEILLLEASALRDKGDPEHAVAALTESLTLAEPEGYVRIFLDESQPMQHLLAQWLSYARTDSSPHEALPQDYAARLLSQFDAEPLGIAAAQAASSRIGELVEPLTQRELEVLHLLALGETNKEIAEQLIIAPGTVKAHTSNIYGKLGVANRTEAAARARQLGILP